MFALSLLPGMLSAFAGSVITVGILWWLGYVRLDEPKRLLAGLGKVAGRDATATVESTDKDKKST
jgi:hypothetical protein